VFAGERTFAHPPVGPLERLFYRLSGVDPDREQSWLVYALCFLGFHARGFLVLYGLLRLQRVLPLNPQHPGGVAPDLAFNTAVSFVTNTSWQA
jgi:K+-transporting ATPase ATPase A chain